jgi:hypothetical protein
VKGSHRGGREELRVLQELHGLHGSRRIRWSVVAAPGDERALNFGSAPMGGWSLVIAGFPNFL